ncbi:hypothetical protein ONZ51_g9228 [Trametes cubensis]|uniref:Uncharacterized protein n=1 Tax=Trametes cubensis TaxID=1111947 RepID=A0AAD7TN04_9APHY|nr:hypothetical protein ONZ51_g9228 [Trametes cubensis]
MKRQATKILQLNAVGVEGLHDLRACSRSLRHRSFLQIRIERTMLPRWMFVNPLACGAVKTREQGDTYTNLANALLGATQPTTLADDSPRGHPYAIWSAVQPIRKGSKSLPDGKLSSATTPSSALRPVFSHNPRANFVAHRRIPVAYRRDLELHR